MRDKPACPACGRHDGEPISSKEAYLNDPPEDGDTLISIVTIYLCSCGQAFTHTDRQEQRGAHSGRRERGE